MNTTNGRISFAERISKKKYTIIVLSILALVVGHFVIQVSFISNESLKRDTESAAQKELVREQNIQTEPEVLENNSQEEVAQVKKTDAVLSPKALDPQKDIKKINVIQRERHQQNDPVAIQNPLKKEVINKSKSERLRRAERLLTGF